MSKRTPLLMLICVSFFANMGLHAAPVPDKARIQERLQKLIPGARIDKLSPSPIDGLYQVETGHNILYSTADGHYVIYGHMLDLTRGSPLSITEEALKTIRLNLVHQLATDSIIAFKPKSLPVKHRIWVFSDIDCGYCRQFHLEVPKLNAAGIAVDYIAFPRAGVGSEAYEKAKAVWCAQDQQTAMTNAKLGKTIGPMKANCDGDALIKRQMQLVQQLDLRATPVIMLEDGTLIPGYLPAEQLIKEINKMKTSSES